MTTIKLEVTLEYDASRLDERLEGTTLSDTDYLTKALTEAIQYAGLVGSPGIINATVTPTTDNTSAGRDILERLEAEADGCINAQLYDMENDHSEWITEKDEIIHYDDRHLMVENPDGTIDKYEIIIKLEKRG